MTPRKPPTREGVDICPGPAGGKEWTHAAFSPRTRLLYVPVIESCANFRVEPVEFKEGLPYYGGEATTHPDHWGAVRAFDPTTGRRMWEWRNDGRQRGLWGAGRRHRPDQAGAGTATRFVSDSAAHQAGRH